MAGIILPYILLWPNGHPKQEQTMKPEEIESKTPYTAEYLKSILKEGDEIYFLSNYNFYCAKVIKVNKSLIKIGLPSYHGCIAHEKSVSFEKIALPKEEIAVIWELWKGVNGRGGYRIERSLYSGKRVPAEKVAVQSYGPGRLTELSYGALHPTV